MLRRRILTSAVVGLLLAIAAGVLGQAYASGLPDEYTAESVVIFGSRPTDNGGVTGSDAVQASASGYVAFLSAPSTLREVSDGIGEDPVGLKDGLTITQLPATATIRINYETTDPDRAARGANALASAVTARTVSDRVVFAQVLARAAVPLNPSGPQRTILTAASVLVAVLVGAGAATAVWTLTGLLARRRASNRSADVATPSVAAGPAGTAPPVAAPSAAAVVAASDGDPSVRERLASLTGGVAVTRPDPAPADEPAAAPPVTEPVAAAPAVTEPTVDEPPAADEPVTDAAVDDDALAEDDVVAEEEATEERAPEPEALAEDDGPDDPFDDDPVEDEHASSEGHDEDDEHEHGSDQHEHDGHHHDGHEHDAHGSDGEHAGAPNGVVHDGSANRPAKRPSGRRGPRGRSTTRNRKSR